MKTWKIKLILYSTFAVALVVSIVIALTPAGPEEKGQADLLKKINSELQPYPGAKPASEDFEFDVNEAIFIAHYETPEDFKTVAEFYRPQLTTRGWVFETQGSDGSRHYRKGAYQILLHPVHHPKLGFGLRFTWNRP